VISGVTVVTTLVCFFICTRGCGCIERPAFPAPSEFRERDINGKTSGAPRREIAESYVKCHNSSLRGANRSRECAPDDRLRDEAIHSYFAATWIASLALAMTVSMRATLTAVVITRESG
jgi:hypothetical protein